MKKNFLGIISLLYSAIIGYAWVSDHLKNYLAPTMQIYIKLSLVPMIIMGCVILISKHKHYHFKISDIFLMLPIILLLFSGDGRLSANLASNRMMNYNSEQRTKQDNTTVNVENDTSKNSLDEVLEKKEISDDIPQKYDFSNPDFNIIDQSYGTLSSYLTYESKATKYEGKTIKVKGFAVKYASYLPDGLYAIGKYVISCCVADASFSGFFIKYNNEFIKHNSWYEVEGILTKGKDLDGYDIMYIEVIHMTEIDGSKENPYIYPCYSYDDGTCSEITKYNLEY